MTDFLYPFIEGDERDAGSLLDDLARSAEAKAGASAALRDATLASARRRARRGRRRHGGAVPRGGRLFAFGNGGSSTDAAGVAALFGRPPVGPAAAGPLAGGRPRRAHRAGQRRRLRAGVLPAADLHRRPRATSPSGCRPAAARPTCSGPSPRRAGSGCSPSGWPATTAAAWRRRTPSTTASSCGPTACTGSRRSRAPWSSTSGSASSDHLAEGDADDRVTSAKRRCWSASRPSGGAAPG